MVTVRKVFEKAFGPIPEVATCHMLRNRGDYTKHELVLEPTYCIASYDDTELTIYTYVDMELGWVVRPHSYGYAGPDISDRDGGPNGFLGFFGEEYDKAYWELANG